MIVRISNIEIMGTTRRNRNISQTNRPIVPTYVIQSQIVPEYMLQDEGRKSRERLVTTITYRSSHIPMLTTMAMANSRPMFVRTFLNQSSWGTTPLQKISAQYMYQ